MKSVRGLAHSLSRVNNILMNLGPLYSETMALSLDMGDLTSTEKRSEDVFLSRK